MRKIARNPEQPLFIWAIDAFESSRELMGSAEKVFRQLAPFGAQILPVYILTPAQFNIGAEVGDISSLPPSIAEYRPAAMKALKGLLRGRKIDGLLDPEIISLETASARQSAEALSGFAVQENAKAIVVSSHNRSRLERFILGSFADTLLYTAEVPVLVLHPQRDEAGSFQNILFPTDFGPNAEIEFRHAVSLAQEMKSSVVLFHSVPYPLEPVLQSGVYLLGGGWMPILNYAGNEVQRRSRRAYAWARWALAQHGVRVEVDIRGEGGGVADLIVERASEGDIDLIALSSHGGWLAAALLGSIARQVTRNANCPVWVFRSDHFVDGKRFARAAA